MIPHGNITFEMYVATDIFPTFSQNILSLCFMTLYGVLLKLTFPFFFFNPTSQAFQTRQVLA